jgi:hypothetical protein
MVMKRLAAIAATALVALATGPGVALASAGGPSPQPIQSPCLRGGVVVKRGVPVRAFACCGIVVIKGGPPGLRPVPGIGRPVPGPGRPVPATACRIQLMTFDMPAFSSTATEVSGPRLSAHELVVYKQQVFMIASVQGRAFTLDRLPVPFGRAFPVGGKPVPVSKPHLPGKRFPFGKKRVAIVKLAPFTNGATAITDGRAFVLHGPVAVVVSIKPAPLSGRPRYPIGAGTRTAASRNLLTWAARPGAVSRSVCTCPGRIASRAAARAEPSQLPSLRPPPSSA